MALTKSLLVFAILACGIAASSRVHAGELRLGAQAVVSPDGKHTYDVPGEEVLTDSLAPSYGVAALVGYDVARYLSVGVAPSALFGVGLDRDSHPETYTELDLALRVTGRVPLDAAGTELQLHVAPGYSWILDSSDRRTTPAGRSLGIGIGLAVPVSSRLSIVGDIGKTYGWQRTNARGYYMPEPVETVRNIGYSFDTLRIGLGVQATL
jgi:hypothetical protein